MWEEENKKEVVQDPKGSDLRNIGISTGDFDADTETADNIEGAEEAPEGEPGTAAGPVGDVASAPNAAAGQGGGPGGGSPMQF